MTGDLFLDTLMCMTLFGALALGYLLSDVYMELKKWWKRKK